MYGIIPSVIAERDVTIDDNTDEYKEDLPMLINAIEEFCRWKRRKIVLALKACNKHMHPHIYILLRINATVLLTSCECGGSGSVLKILNKYLRASMGRTRLNALAFLHINYVTSIEVERVIRIFGSKRQIVLEFVTIYSVNCKQFIN